MATKTITQTLDDLDGTEGAARYTFALNGTTFEIDLTDEHFNELATALAKFIAAARPTSTTATPRTESKTAKSSTGGTKRPSSLPDFDKETFKAWSMTNGRWTGKRPKNSDVLEFLATQSR